MQTVDSSKKLQLLLEARRRHKLKIGFVPTMGALHAGHLSLIRTAKRQNDFVVVSIFVNPLQFGPKEDFKHYPRTLKADARACARAGADLVFHPYAETLFRDNPPVIERATALAKPLCGRFRPGHFRGVLTIVALLLRLVKPHRLYLGLKDYQQYLVIRELVKRRFSGKIEVVGCPTVREKDGLAMSSRNVYLTAAERKTALQLSQTLQMGAEFIENRLFDPLTVQKLMQKRLQKNGISKIDYVEIVDARTLRKVVKSKPPAASGSILLAAAVHIGKTRLIDNFLV